MSSNANLLPDFDEKSFELPPPKALHEKLVLKYLTESLILYKYVLEQKGLFLTEMTQS